MQFDLGDLSPTLNAAAHCVLVPPGLLLVILASGLILVPYRPVLGRALAWGGTASLLLLCMSPVDRLLSLAAGGFAPFDASRAGAAQAIVILAAEVRLAPEYASGYSVADLTLERLRYGARLARQTGLPVLLSGGPAGANEGVAMAELMQATLHDDFGIDARWLETRSRNTRENARESAAILGRGGITTAVLVTDDNHMRRAIREFEAAGVHIIAAPVRVPGSPQDGEWTQLLPSLSAFRGSSLAIYELIAQAQQWLAPPPTRPQ